MLKLLTFSGFITWRSILTEHWLRTQPSKSDIKCDFWAPAGFVGGKKKQTVSPIVFLLPQTITAPQPWVFLLQWRGKQGGSNGARHGRPIIQVTGHIKSFLTLRAFSPSIFHKHRGRAGCDQSRSAVSGSEQRGSSFVFTFLRSLFTCHVDVYVLMLLFASFWAGFALVCLTNYLLFSMAEVCVSVILEQPPPSVLTSRVAVAQVTCFVLLPRKYVALKIRSVGSDGRLLLRCSPV